MTFPYHILLWERILLDVHFQQMVFFFFLAENSKWFLDYNITDFLMVYFDTFLSGLFIF